MAQEPVLMTAVEVAELLRVDPATIRRWASEGQLPAIRLPGKRALRFRRSDVDALLVDPTREALLA